MTDIVEFLTARLDEDEAAAKAAGVGSHDTWHAIEWYDGQFEGGLTVSVDVHGIAGAPITSRGALLRVDGEHIARHDPARVLAEVKAKRVLIEHWRTYAEQHRRDDCDPEAGSAWAAMSYVLVTLAGVYRTHPDYAADSVDDWTWPDDDPAWNVNPA